MHNSADKQPTLTSNGKQNENLFFLELFSQVFIYPVLHNGVVLNRCLFETDGTLIDFYQKESTFAETCYFYNQTQIDTSDVFNLLFSSLPEAQAKQAYEHLGRLFLKKKENIFKDFDSFVIEQANNHLIELAFSHLRIKKLSMIEQNNTSVEFQFIPELNPDKLDEKVIKVKFYAAGRVEFLNPEQSIQLLLNEQFDYLSLKLNESYPNISYSKFAYPWSWSFTDFFRSYIVRTYLGKEYQLKNLFNEELKLLPQYKRFSIR